MVNTQRQPDAPSLTFASSRALEVKWIGDGTVGLEGFSLTFPDRPKSGLVYYAEIVSNLTYDIGDLAFAHYLVAKDMGKPLTAIPVFPNRFIPHYGLSVNKHANIKSPQDLVEKRMGAPDWGFNPAVWIRGILAHQYDVPLERITWVESNTQPLFPGMSYPRSPRYQHDRLTMPDDLAWNQPQTYGMRAMLEDNVVNAACFPASGMDPTENTQRLFENPYQEAHEYVRQTGVIPINTVVTLHENTVQKYPELPGRLMAAFTEAHGLYRKQLEQTNDGDYTGVPVELVKEAGAYPFEHGLARNRREVSMMIHYCYEQGLINKLYEPEDLFCFTD